MSLATVPAVQSESKAVVLFDGDCAFCQRSVRILKGLDWFGRLAFQNARDQAHWPASAEPLALERLVEEMHVVTPDRQHAYAGFRAFRWMAWRIPLTMLSAPFLYLPGVLWAGNRVYRWIARNRYSLVPCHDGVCQIPKKDWNS